MLALQRARVAEVTSSKDGLTEIMLSLDNGKVRAVSYDELTGGIAEGDEVIVNTTAVDLGLGTGGVHFVLWNLKRSGLRLDGEGHIMKLRYTPLQFACLAAEESDSPHHEILKNICAIDSMPVIIGTLHSQLAPAVATLKSIDPALKIAYIMTDGAALPLALSKTVADLKKKKLLDTTITIGNAFGGDLEAINIYSGLVGARAAALADITVVTMGPGIVGTDTALGFSGIEQGQIVNAVASLGGVPIAIPRISFKDSRGRHRALSHHTVTALGTAALARSTLVFSAMEKSKMDEVMDRVRGAGLDKKHDIRIIDNKLTGPALEQFGLTVSTMGRGFEDEPEFFLTAGASAVVAIEFAKEP